MSDTVPPGATVAPGFYNLTADVENPRPDRRMRGLAHREWWARGTLVQVIPPAGERDCGAIFFTDHTSVLYGGGGKHPGTFYRRHGDPILSHLTPAGDTLGVVVGQSPYTAADILAMLLESRVIDDETVRLMIGKLNVTTPDNDGPILSRLKEFRRKYNIGDV